MSLALELMQTRRVVIDAGLHLLRWLPERLAIAVSAYRTDHPARPPVSPEEDAALAKAETLHYGNGKTAWSWGRGPLVILVHGLMGRASQLAPLGMRIAAQGFRAVAFDVSGHGESRQSRTSWTIFFRDIAALAQGLGEPVHAYVGHSAGAMAMMAARRMTGISARHYVCICTPSHPYKSVEAMHRRVANASVKGTDRYKAYLADQFKVSWRELEAGWAFEGAGADTLFVCDQTDRFVSPDESDRMHALCAGSSLLKTRDHGHNRILLAPEIADAIGGFLKRGRLTADVV